MEKNTAMSSAEANEINQMAMNWTCVDESRPQSTGVKENCHVKWEGGCREGKCGNSKRRRMSSRHCKRKSWVEKLIQIKGSDDKIRCTSCSSTEEGESLGPCSSHQLRISIL
jgi:hypothetical protein